MWLAQKIGNWRLVRSHRRHDATRLRCRQIVQTRHDSSRLSPTSCEFNTPRRQLSRVGGVYWALTARFRQNDVRLSGPGKIVYQWQSLLKHSLYDRWQVTLNPPSNAVGRANTPLSSVRNCKPLQYTNRSAVHLWCFSLHTQFTIFTTDGASSLSSPTNRNRFVSASVCPCVCLKSLFIALKSAGVGPSRANPWTLSEVVVDPWTYNKHSNQALVSTSASYMPLYLPSMYMYMSSVFQLS